MKRKTPLPFQTPGEEIANSVLHGIGALLAVAGLTLLLLRGNGLYGGSESPPRVIVSYAIYGATLILLFLSSTLYHALTSERAKQIFRVFDHSAIYVLIAGTYTPFCLGPLSGPWGWTLFGLEWGLALLGITLYAIGLKVLKKVEVAVYILMGWAVVMGWGPLSRTLKTESLVLLIAGGLFYTAGTIWYGKKAKRWTHVIWHIFVLAGAVTHWFAVYLQSF